MFLWAGNRRSGRAPLFDAEYGRMHLLGLGGNHEPELGLAVLVAAVQPLARVDEQEGVAVVADPEAALIRGRGFPGRDGPGGQPFRQRDKLPRLLLARVNQKDRQVPVPVGAAEFEAAAAQPFP